MSRIKEKYSFLTDIITSYSGKEQRIKLRQVPRRSYEFDYDAMDGLQGMWVRGIMRFRISDAYYLPMWQSPVLLRKDFNGGKNLEVNPDTMYGARDCTYLFIFAHDDMTGTINDIVKINNVYDGVIELRQAYHKALNMKNALIYPLRRCNVTEDMSTKYVYHDGGSITGKFEDLMEKSKKPFPPFLLNEYREIDKINRFSLPYIYKNKDMFIWEPQWTDEEEELSAARNVKRLDTETGVYKYDIKSNIFSDINVLRIVMKTRNEIDNLIKFFTKMGGKYKSFYAPTYANDFVLSRDAKVGDSHLITAFASLHKFYLNTDNHKSIIIFFKDWTYKIIPIAGYTYEMRNDQRYGKLLLGETLDKDINMKDVFIISYLNLVRFDSDDLEIEYETVSVATAQVTLREVHDV